MSDNLYWVWLSRACLWHRGLFDRLRRRYAGAWDVYQAEPQELETLSEMSEAEIRALSDKDLSWAQRMMDYCMLADVCLLTYSSPAFPANLRELSDPPLVLYYKGRLPDFYAGDLFISVVGTRRMSDYGKRMTHEISYDLARAGAIVVTGMALGVDGLAAASALAAGGRTLAFLGSGIDIIYPREHTYLMRQILRNGAVVTEYPPGTPPDRSNFPYRNRLISAISKGVLIIEGNERSGALITAKKAVEQGRDVYALPGNADETNSEAPNYLLKHGAIPVSCADDIIRRYEFLYGGRLNIFSLLQKKIMTADRVMETYRVATGNGPAHQRATSYTYAEQSDAAASGKRRAQARRGAPVPPVPAEAEIVTDATTDASTLPDNSTAPATVTAGEEEKDARMARLDATTIAVYKKLPIGRAVAPDALCTEELTIDQVMGSLTFLEVNKFITSCAGGLYMRR